MLFEKEHLSSDHYTWKKEMYHAYMAEPDRRLFDRGSGDQVLFMINFFGKSLGRLTVSDGRKIEALICEELPGDIKSELSVFNWLRGIYLYYGN